MKAGPGFSRGDFADISFSSITLQQVEREES